MWDNYECLGLERLNSVVGSGMEFVVGDINVCGK